MGQTGDGDGIRGTDLMRDGTIGTGTEITVMALAGMVGTIIMDGDGMVTEEEM